MIEGLAECHKLHPTGDSSKDFINLVYLTGKIVSDVIKNNTKTQDIPAMNFRLLYHSNTIPCFITVNAYGSIAHKCDFKKGDIIFVRGKLTDDKKYNVGIKAYEFNRIR